MTLENLNTPPVRILTPESVSLLLAEYNALRDEVLKRKEIQSQYISLALIVPGAIFAFGLQAKNGTLILLYPILAMFLATAWANHDRGIRLIGAYIRSRIESKVGEESMGWEHFMSYHRKSHKLPGSLNIFATSGIFLGTEVLAILVGVSIVMFDITVIFIFCIDIISIIITIFVLRRIQVKGLSEGADKDIVIPHTRKT